MSIRLSNQLLGCLLLDAGRVRKIVKMSLNRFSSGLTTASADRASPSITAARFKNWRENKIVSRQSRPAAELHRWAAIEKAYIQSARAQEISMSNSEFVSHLLLERQKLTILDKQIVFDRKTLTQEYRIEYEFNELRSKTVSGKVGDTGWTNIGSILLAAFFICTFSFTIVFPKLLTPPVKSILPGVLIILSLISYLLRLIKYDCVWFFEKDGSSAFIIKLPEHDQERAQNMISEIIEKIKLTEGKAIPARRGSKKS